MNYYTGVLQTWCRYHAYDDERAKDEEDAQQIITKQRRAEVTEEYHIRVTFDRTFGFD